MTKDALLAHGLSYILDDALSPDHTVADFVANGRGQVVGFQCGFDQLLVGVMSSMDDCAMGADEAVEIAEDYLREIGWLHHDTEITVYDWAGLAN